MKTCGELPCLLWAKNKQMKSWRHGRVAEREKGLWGDHAVAKNQVRQEMTEREKGQDFGQDKKRRQIWIQIRNQFGFSLKIRNGFGLVQFQFGYFFKNLFNSELCVIG